MKRNELIETLIDMAMDPDDEFKPTKGQEIVLESYEDMKHYDSEHLVIDNIAWSEPRKQMTKLLRDAGVDRIIITYTGSALMGLIHFLTEDGCEIENTIIVKRKKDGHNINVRGLQLIVN